MYASVCLYRIIRGGLCHLERKWWNRTEYNRSEGEDSSYVMNMIEGKVRRYPRRQWPKHTTGF
jgi:hypothetical protein